MISLFSLEKNTKKTAWSRVCLLHACQPAGAARAETGARAGARSHAALDH